MPLIEKCVDPGCMVLCKTAELVNYSSVEMVKCKSKLASSASV